jgi:hypothetical protein
MASHQHQAPAGQTLAEVIGSSTKRSKRASDMRVRSGQWERRIEEDWQGHLKTLGQCISELLVGNQHPRMELIKADKRRQE